MKSNGTVLITGASGGIGSAICNKFLDMGYFVYGMDVVESDIQNSFFEFVYCDVTDVDNYPELPAIDILINCAGVQNSIDDIDINLKGLIHITEHYGVHPAIKSILNIGSASGHTGAEFPFYAASKGGVLTYTKNVAMRVAPATCNSLDPGGVLDSLNDCVIQDNELWNHVMELTPLKKWATPEEMAEWAYFLTVINKFATAQNFLVDGGEAAKFDFVWKED